MKNEPELTFSRLESYQEFLRNPNNLHRCGVYVWGFRFVDPKVAATSDFIPYYVGRHLTSIYHRIQHHVYDMREGTHKILKHELLNDPNKYRSLEPSDLAYANFKNDDGSNRPKNSLPIEEKLQLIPHINAYTDNLFITYLDVSHLGLSPQEERTYIYQLETYVQDIIGEKVLQSRRGRKYTDDFRPTIGTSAETQHLLRNYPLP